MLPALVPPRGRTKLKNKTSWKPSISEARDSIVRHVKSAGDIETIKLAQVNFAYSKGLPLQPYLILVGSNLNNITGALVVINENEYKCDSVLLALDFCFKAYQILDAQYPIPSKHLWYLIQWKLYNYRNKKDIQIPYLNEFL